MANPEIDQLFIAIPELAFKVNFLEELLNTGAISQTQYERIKATRSAAKRFDRALDAGISSQGIIGRLMAVAPELINVSNVNLLRSFGLITEQHGHALRILVRSAQTLLPVGNATIAQRLMKLVGAQISYERIDLWSSMGVLVPRGRGQSKQDWLDANSKVAERMRGALAAGTSVQEGLVKVVRAKNLLDAMYLLGQLPMSKDLINGMVRAELLDPRIAATYLKVLDLGRKQWTVFEGAKRAEGLRARLMLVLTGSLNGQMLDFLLSLNIITKEQRYILFGAEVVANRVNQRMLENLTKRRMRIVPGEAPVKTFLRSSRVTEGELLRLLADAAKEARDEAKKLADSPNIGARTRARQYNLEARALHLSMRKMWEGIGYLSIFGERKVAEAAIESAMDMQRGILKGLPPGMEQSMMWQAKAGIDSYISREENTLALSRTVYKNMAYWEGKVDERIKLSLLQGKSAAEIANDVRGFINPRTPGGVSYSAMRLGRTELNNAFHFGTIRYTRESPWVIGYKWHLSDSHKVPDDCNRNAEEDHDSLGAGIFKKANVPGKPHPQCFCYITTEQMDYSTFQAADKAGRFNAWYKSIQDGSNDIYGGEVQTAGLDTMARSIYGHVGNAALAAAQPALRGSLSSSGIG